MKITQHQLRQIIREELLREASKADPRARRKVYSDVEIEYFGFDMKGLANLAKSLHRLGDFPDERKINKIASKVGKPIEFLGSGSWRLAYAIGNDLVIKHAIVLTDEDVDASEVHVAENAAQMNKDDFIIGTDSAVDQVVPRAYLHAPDWSWVVLERVESLGDLDLDDLLIYFRSQYLPDPKTTKGSLLSGYFSIILGALSFKDPNFPDSLALKEIGSLGPNWEHGDVTLGVLRRDLQIKSQLFMGLTKALRKYNIAVNEIESNLGRRADGSIVLLDSSIFFNS
jgi:hypothetical protein